MQLFIVPINNIIINHYLKVINEMLKKDHKQLWYGIQSGIKRVLICRVLNVYMFKLILLKIGLINFGLLTKN